VEEICHITALVIPKWHKIIYIESNGWQPVKANEKKQK
jgi:hypothetical protein